MQAYTVTVVRMGKVRHPIQSTPRPVARCRRVVPAPAVAKPPPRTYYAKRLLEHGPLQFKEFVDITGWDKSCAKRVLESLSATSVAKFNGREWELVG